MFRLKASILRSRFDVHRASCYVLILKSVFIVLVNNNNNNLVYQKRNYNYRLSKEKRIES